MKKNINALLRNSKKMSNIEPHLNKTKCVLKMIIDDNHIDDYLIRWKNFKGFKDTGDITIKPITIIIGPNNCGKSSFLAPFLLMNQTIINNEGDSPLIISDKVYDGGNVKELVNNFDLSKNFTFSFRYHIHTSNTPKRLKKVGYYPPGGVDVTFTTSNDVERQLSVKSETICDLFGRTMVVLERDRYGKYQLKGMHAVGMNPNEKKAIKNSEPLNFLFSPNSLLYSLEETENPNNESRNKSRPTKAFSDLVRDITRNFNEARSRLGRISYLGPIRDTPKRYYQLKNIFYNTVGARGENVPDIINREKGIKAELNQWVKRFEFGDTVEFKKFDGSNSMGSIVFRNKGEEIYTNIANAGFGASQILPLIVQALMSDDRILTIAEQPEIHLNPRLQVVLADLFAYMAKKGQKIVVETHSEHLLLSLRNLVAKGDLTTDEIAIYFVEKENGESKIRPISIDSNGKIPSGEWPKGFFGDTLKQSLALAAQQAINRKSQKK